MTARIFLFDRLTKLFKELIPTFLGVFLAFYLNDVWVNQQEKQSIDQVKQTLQEELTQNITLIKRQIDYHQMVEDSAAHLAKLYFLDRDESKLPLANFWNGLQGSHLSDAAYHTAISTQNLAKMELKIANAVAGAYSAQRNYESVLQSARSALLGRDWPNYISWINYMRWSANNLKIAEMAVVQTHEKALECLKQYQVAKT